MKKHIQFVKTFCMAILCLTLAAGMLMPESMVFAASISDGDFDGDVVENPWADLFEQNNGSSSEDLELPGADSSNMSSQDGVTRNESTKDSDVTKKSSNSGALSAAGISKVKIKKAVSKGKNSKKIKVKVKKVAGALGYQVRVYKAKKKAKKNKKAIIKKKSTSKNIVIKSKKLKGKKKVFIRARAYAKDSSGKKIYGTWSKIKKIKM